MCFHQVQGSGRNSRRNACFLRVATEINIAALFVYDPKPAKAKQPIPHRRELQVGQRSLRSGVCGFSGNGPTTQTPGTKVSADNHFSVLQWTEPPGPGQRPQNQSCSKTPQRPEAPPTILSCSCTKHLNTQSTDFFGFLG